MEHIRKLAWVSVARGCGFGGLAIFTMMIGLSSTPAAALDFGGIGFLLMSVILIVKAYRSDRLPHKHTEIWLMLEPDLRPPPEVAPAVIMRTRREVILRFAHMSALAALCCLVMAGALQIMGVR
jgi:hypothetical protein